MFHVSEQYFVRNNFADLLLCFWTHFKLLCFTLLFFREWWIIKLWKVSVFGVFMVRFFPHSNWIRTRKNPNTDTFHPVTLCEKLKVYWGKIVSVYNMVFDRHFFPFPWHVQMAQYRCTNGLLMLELISAALWQPKLRRDTKVNTDITKISRLIQR